MALKYEDLAFEQVLEGLDHRSSEPLSFRVVCSRETLGKLKSLTERELLQRIRNNDAAPEIQLLRAFASTGLAATRGHDVTLTPYATSAGVSFLPQPIDLSRSYSFELLEQTVVRNGIRFFDGIAVAHFGNPETITYEFNIKGVKSPAP